MKTTEKQGNDTIFIDIIFIGALLAFILLSFFTFTRDNNQRVLEQNESFIKAATEQKVERLDELIDMSMSSVKQMAYLYGELMTSPTATDPMLNSTTGTVAGPVPKKKAISGPTIKALDTTGGRTAGSASPRTRTPRSL